MVDEYEALLNTMNALPGETRKRALSRSLRAMGKVVEKAIKVRAPAQAGEYSHGALAPGELAADIRTSVHIAQDEKATSDSDFVTIGPSKKTEYIARFVEDGHATRPRKTPSKRPRVERVDPHPFVRPAYDATREEAITVFGDTMAEEIAKAFSDAE